MMWDLNNTAPPRQQEPTDTSVEREQMVGTTKSDEKGTHKPEKW